MSLEVSGLIYESLNLPAGISLISSGVSGGLISGTISDDSVTSSLVTVSYPGFNIEPKEIVINWEVYVPKVRVSGFTGELSWMNADYIIRRKGDHGLEAYLPKNSDGYFDSKNKIFGNMSFFISYLPDPDINVTNFGFGGIVYHEDYYNGESMYFDAQRWVSIGW